MRGERDFFAFGSFSFQMLSQVVQEWREAAAMLGRPRQEEEEDEQTQERESGKERDPDVEHTQRDRQEPQKARLLLSLHGQLQQVSGSAVRVKTRGVPRRRRTSRGKRLQ